MSHHLSFFRALPPVGFLQIPNAKRKKAGIAPAILTPLHGE
jgi:hypothetical protein